MQSLVDHLPERQPRRVGTVFFKQSNKLIKSLIDFYRKDFELFGYEWSRTDGLICGYQYGCGETATCI